MVCGYEKGRHLVEMSSLVFFFCLASAKRRVSEPEDGPTYE